MAILSNELRIGNWFKFISTNEYSVVRDIRTDSVMKPSVNRVSLEDLEPIPLTPDILRDNLFFVYQASNYQYNEPNWIYKGEDVLPFGIDEENGIYYFNGLQNMPDVQIKYVHELQNLYQCLCGEELKITF